MARLCGPEDDGRVEAIATKLLLQGYPPLRAISLADEFVMELNIRAGRGADIGQSEDES